MSYQNPYDFALAVSRGLVAGHSYVLKYGYNADIDSGTDEDVIEQGGDCAFPTSAESLEIISDSGSDVAAGTGARTVTVQGIDNSYAYQSQTVTVTGTLAAAISGTWRRVYRAFVATAGNTNSNVGTLTIRVSGGGATRLIISPTKSQTNFACWTVPINTKAYITQFHSAINGGSPSGVTVDIQLWVQDAINVGTGVRKQKENIGLVSTGTTAKTRPFNPYLEVVGPADIWLRADVDTSNTFISGSFDLYLVDD